MTLCREELGFCGIYNNHIASKDIFMQRFYIPKPLVIWSDKPPTLLDDS